MISHPSPFLKLFFSCFFFFFGEVDQLVGRHNHGNLLMPPQKRNEEIPTGNHQTWKTGKPKVQRNIMNQGKQSTNDVSSVAIFFCLRIGYPKI